MNKLSDTARAALAGAYVTRGKHRGQLLVPAHVPTRWRQRHGKAP
jgi:hypothetical protein